MKMILLFGAGKSSTVLIEYLFQNAKDQDWEVVVVDADLELAQNKVQSSNYGRALSFNIKDTPQRQRLIEKSTLVISLLPPAMHMLIAKDCILFQKYLLTASYIDAEMEKLRPEIEEKGLLFLCEMGLDPGIDHMSAKKRIDEIQCEGGVITFFRSHCGGLVAEESDDNPWHYKISWNPRNVVQAGKSGATFKQEGVVINLSYPEVFSEKRWVQIGSNSLCWYPNRNAEEYAKIYKLENCPTFIRTTLRHPDFIKGWKNVIDLKLTDDTVLYETNGKSFIDFFKEHLDQHNLNRWIEEKIKEDVNPSEDLLSGLSNMSNLEENVETNSTFHKKILLENAPSTKVDTKQEVRLTLQQLFYLGFNSTQTIDKGKCTAADVLTLALENKLKLQKNDKDKVVMLHEIEYQKRGKKFRTESLLERTGSDNQHTAMATTVGLPLGIAAKLILNGTLQLKGLHIPVLKEIYQPILTELEKQGIAFKETTIELP